MKNKRYKFLFILILGSAQFYVSYGKKNAEEEAKQEAARAAARAAYMVPVNYTEQEQYLVDNYCENPEESMKVFEKYQDTGGSKSKYYLSMGKVYNECLADKQAAIHWYQKSALLGNGIASYHLSKIYEELGDTAAAQQWKENAKIFGTATTGVASKPSN